MTGEENDSLQKILLGKTIRENSLLELICLEFNAVMNGFNTKKKKIRSLKT